MSKNAIPLLTHSHTHTPTHSPLGWILMILALVSLVAILSTSSGCALFKASNAVVGAAADAAKELEDKGATGKKVTVVKQVESKIGFWLGLAAGLGALAIVAGGIILGYGIINGGSWKKGVALFVGGIIVTCGIYATAIILPWLKWIVLGILLLIVILVLAWVGYVIYQVFVLKRGFKEVVTTFQRKKNSGWNRETIDFMNKNQTPQTRKMVREIKATLPKPEPPETLKVAQD